MFYLPSPRPRLLTDLSSPIASSLPLPTPPSLVKSNRYLTMIIPEERLWAGSGSLTPGGPYTWYIVDTCIHWPWMPKEPEVEVLVLGQPESGSQTHVKSVPALVRQELVRRNKPLFRWERPASYRLGDKLEGRTSSATAGQVSDALGDGCSSEAPKNVQEGTA